MQNTIFLSEEELSFLFNWADNSRPGFNGNIIEQLILIYYWYSRGSIVLIHHP